MTEPSNTASFEKIVQWAYSTLPEKIRNLPDFPGIQLADEPPVEMFDRMSKRSNWHPGTELLGCYSGVSRTKHDEGEVKELGLSLSFRDIPRDPLESEAATALAQQRFPDRTEKDDEANQKLRCPKMLLHRCDVP
jgi:hypothetical protein